MIFFKRMRANSNQMKPLFLLLAILLFVVSCANEPVAEVESENAPRAAETATLASPATPRPAASGELVVDTAVTRGPINPMVYGANYGPWSGVPVNALEDLENSGITFLRFPGGNWGDDQLVRGNHVDMLKLYGDMIDAELVVSANLREGTPEQAVELMQLFEEKGLEVKYWSIGNEPNLFAGKLNHEEWDTQYFNARWREFAEAMLAHDPDILLVGPDLSQYTAVESQNPKDAAGLDWMREFLRANGDLVDNVSFHRYPFGNTPTIAEVRATSPEWDETLPYLRDLIREETGRDIPLSVMEVNSNWSHAIGGEGTPDSFYNAIWWADSLGRIIEHNVEMVGFFSLAHNKGTTLLGRNEPSPTYYVYQLFQQFGNEKLYADSGIKDVSIYASRRDDGTLTLMVVNRGDAGALVPLILNNYTGGKTAASTGSVQAVLHRFDATHKAENLGEVSINLLSLPGQSISLYVLPDTQE